MAKRFSHHPSQEEITEFLNQCDTDYDARQDFSRVKFMMDALSALAGTDLLFETQWRLARGAFFLGSITDQVSDSRQYFQSGCTSGAQAVKLASERVEGHLWHGINLALLAQCLPFWSALPAIWQAQASLQQAVERDPRYHEAAAYRVLGRIAHKLPRWLGGGFTKSQAYFQQAIALAPTNSVTRIYYAELLLDTHHQDEAVEHLQHILNTPENPHWKFENQRDRGLAENYLRIVNREL